MKNKKFSKKQIAQQKNFKKVQKKCKGKTGKDHKSCVREGLEK